MSFYFIWLPITILIILFIDLLYTKTIQHYSLKLIITLLFIFGILFFLDYTGLILKLWIYPGEGLSGLYYLSLPLEEYLYLFIAPFIAIIVWETFHKAIKR